MKGTVYNNNGKWYYRVKFPGDTKRTLHKLCAPGHNVAMSADRPRELAVQAAWRIWEAHTKRPCSLTVGVPSVEQICAAYCLHSKTYYRRQDGKPTSEQEIVPRALRPLRALYGDTPVTALTHADMIRVRNAIIGWGTCSRTTVNAYMARIRRMWVWALDEGLIGAKVKAELTQVQPLKPYRTNLREPVPVMSVPDADVEAVCRIAPPNFADMVRVHRLTGMRPAEVCMIRWQDIDRSHEPWVYRPPVHKTQWSGHVRAVLIGPRARAILAKYLDGDFDGYPFCPARIIAGGAKGGIGQVASIPTRRGIKFWTTATYTAAVVVYRMKCRCGTWAPNQIRHTFATQVRREFGVYKAGMLLGHSNGMKITNGYSHEAAVDEIIRESGAVIEQIG